MAARAAHAFERLLASDPSLQRLRAGLRALVTALVGAGLLLPLARALHLPSNVALTGVLVPLMSSVALQDATPGRQRRTLLLMPLVTIPVVLLGAWTGGHALCGGIVFVAVIAGGMLARRFGPRGAGLGSLAWLSYFYALLLHLPLADGGWTALAIVAGTAIAWLVRLPFAETPDRLLHSELRAYRARMAVLLRDLARSLGGHERAAHRSRQELAQLNALSLQVDARLAQFAAAPDGDAQQELRDRLLQAELATETLEHTTAVARDSRHAAACLQVFVEALQALRATVRDGAPYDAARIEVAAREAGDALDPNLQWRFRHAACAIASEPPWTATLPRLDDSPQRPPPARKDVPRAGPRRWYALDENLRRTIQASVAASAAVIAGHAISTDHWFWAVFASFLVFTRATSSGQALSQAWQGVLANVAGVALGLALAEIVHGHATLQLVLLFAFIAAGFYAYPGWQPLYNLLLTAMLALLYELLGQHTPDLLLTRLRETLAGAALAVAAGWLVFPVRTQAHSDRDSASLLREAAVLLRSAFDPPPDRSSAREAVRALDRKLQELRRTLVPVTQATYPAPKASHRRRLHQLSVLVYCIRHLVHLVAEYPRDFRHVPTLAAQAETIAAEADAVAAQVERGEAAADSGPQREQQGAHDDNEHRRAALHWLVRARRLVRDIAGG